MTTHHAIVLTDRKADNLGFMLKGRSPAMLPIGNKPLIQITIEELFEAGIRSLTIADDGERRDLRRFVGDGSRWGMTVDWQVQPSVAAVRESALAKDKTVVAVRGDMLRPFGLLEEAMRRAGEQQSADIYTALGVAVALDDHSGLERINWQHVSATCRLHPCLIADIAAYHAANMMALQGLVPGVRSAGRKTQDEIIIGKGSRVLSGYAPDKSVVIGNNCFIERGVRLGQNVVIGNGCLVDEDAQLQNCVVLPGTYVGRGTVFSNKVVGEVHVHCLQRNATCAVEDTRLLAAA
jgi:mannose-1-phosphate guanylyltransferase/phosphomannomutase